VTEGGTGLLFLISFTFLNPDDEIVFFEPFFQYFEINARMAKAKRRYVELIPNRNGKWEVNFEDLEKKINEKTKILIVNSPHNPTGKVFEKWELEKIADIVRKFPKLIVIADEVYEKSVFVNDGILPRFASLEGMFERTISVLSAGKVYC
jgi:aspartate/methionine/tyrosine aminotransferase